MRFQYFYPLALVAGSAVSAFPSPENLAKLLSKDVSVQQRRCPFAEVEAGVKRVANKRGLSNPLSAPIEVTGEHAFVPPDFASGDQRGPCPGLNALANHGYIPHNGIVSLAEVIPAINEVWGMGPDLGLVLAVMGTVWVGNPISLNPGFSIAGESPAIENLLDNMIGLLGNPRGLNASHNFIESDSSPFRDDLYLTGDAWSLNLTKFESLYDMSTDGTFSMDLIGEFAKDRYYESIATNPNFYYGPFTGAIARNAGYIFAGRLFRNHSSENPEGVLTNDVLKSIFGVSETESGLNYNYGYERIPNNWYRRPVDFGLVDLNLDLLGWAAKYPELLNIGGNLGSVNSFAGVDVSSVTNGVLNAADLLKNNTLLCFVFEVLKTVSPDALTNIYSTVSAPLELVTSLIATSLLNLTCPAFKDMTYNGQPLWKGLQEAFPGAGWTKAAL